MSSGMFLEPSMVGLNSNQSGGVGGGVNGPGGPGGGGGLNGGASTLPRAESTLFRASQQLQTQQSISLNPNPNVWMNTLSKKSTVVSAAWSAQQQSSSRYNLAQVDNNLQLQLQNLQTRFFKGI